MGKPITLYYGDNGAHEFYENDHGYNFQDGDATAVLIFRNHGESAWIAMVDFRVQPGTFASAEGWMRHLAGTLGAAFTVNRECEWKNNDRPVTPPMVLVAVA